MLSKIDVKNGVPILNWCKDIDDGTLSQITDAAKHPCAFKHVALMGDGHLGYGVPIGSVVALNDAISPNMVGVDIGCGMRAVKTTLREVDSYVLGKLKSRIKQVIPVGMKHRKVEIENDFPLDDCFDVLSKMSGIFSNNYKKQVANSMGTLGGGNHFIELQRGSDGFIWVMIHSGSRNFGKKIADHWNGIAVANNKAFHSDRVDVAADLSFLPFSGTTSDADDYLVAMRYALDYARENRKVMMREVLKQFRNVNDGMTECLFELDVHHNYAALENHLGKNVWIHRKGATSARKGQLGIVPGSMGAKSYIVEGKGNELSFNSCSHGAGRDFSRTKATLELDILEQENIMADIVFDGWKEIKRGSKKVRGMMDLGEAPGAYKDIQEVMVNQSDLVRIDTELTPLMVVKG